MSIEGQGHFFTIYFPGFVCFVLYLDKISGERLQDHWSSGFCLLILRRSFSDHYLRWILYTPVFCRLSLQVTVLDYGCRVL